MFFFFFQQIIRNCYEIKKKKKKKKKKRNKINQAFPGEYTICNHTVYKSWIHVKSTWNIIVISELMTHYFNYLYVGIKLVRISSFHIQLLSHILCSVITGRTLTLWTYNDEPTMVDCN